MMKLKLLNILLIVIAFTTCLYSSSHADTTQNCKERLPNEINSYQPILVPVLSPDGNRLYFDRKSYPYNTNKTKDYDDIWYSERISNSNWGEPINLADLNTKDFDVLFWISPDCRKALVYGIYTNNNKEPGFSIAEYNGERWLKPESMLIKDFYNDTTNFYANMSSDGNTLIMAIDRKDAVGGLDLYVSFFNKNTKEWSVPMNMGSDINTKGDEETPYLAYDNKTIYFSSNGLNGEGGQDLYFSKRLDDSWKKWSKPENLGKIINTKWDENGFCLNPTGDTAVVLSYDTVNKRKGFYLACIPRQMQSEPYTILKGNVDFENVISNENTVKIFINNSEVQTLKTDRLKNYAVVLAGKKNYKVFVIADGIGKDSFVLDLSKQKEIKIINHDFNIKQSLHGKNKYTVNFDFDSYELKEESLNTINDIPIEKINTKIFELYGYTDETGSEEYNLKLSKKRAEKVGDFLIKKGIKRKNIKLFAMGEKEPISADPNQNRRVEILIK